MPIRNQSYEDNVGGGYPERERKTSVQIKTDASKKRNSMTNPDPLMQALVKPPPTLPTGNHAWSHAKASRPRGALYTPSGEFGRPNGKMPSKAVGMGPHRSARGPNAVGRPLNMRGSNPLGNYQNKKGVNAVGQPSEMHGENSLGGKPPAHGTFRGNP